MKRIVNITGDIAEVNEIDYNKVSEGTPIFAKDHNGYLKGMVVHEKDGWILRTGGTTGATGFHETRRKCLISCIIHNYSFFVERNS